MALSMLAPSHKKDTLLSGREMICTPDDRDYNHYEDYGYAGRGGYANSGYVDSGYAPHGGGYHEREGYVTDSTAKKSKSAWLYVPSSKWTWAFLGVAVMQAVCGLALEGYVFGEFQIHVIPAARSEAQSKTVPAYLSLFIFGFIYQLILVWDALRLKNTIQIIGLCIYNVGLLVEAAVQFDQIQDVYDRLVAVSTDGESDINPDVWKKIYPVLIAVPCVIALGTLLIAGVAWKLYDEFAWSIYKHISADLRLRRMFLGYQVYIALLKFDFFFFLAFTVQFLVVVSDTTDFEFYITIVAIPVTVILLVLAAWWTRREAMWGMVTTIIVYFAGLAYFLFKLVRMYDGPPARVADYRPARRSLTTFAVITVILLVVTIVYACICTSNFNRGLKPHVGNRKKGGGIREREGSGGGELDKLYSNAGSVPLAGPGPRITID